MIPAGVRQMDQQDHFDDDEDRKRYDAGEPDLPQGRHRAHRRQ
jgi:hypothetical protein